MLPDGTILYLRLHIDQIIIKQTKTCLTLQIHVMNIIMHIFQKTGLQKHKSMNHSTVVNKRCRYFGCARSGRDFQPALPVFRLYNHLLV